MAKANDTEENIEVVLDVKGIQFKFELRRSVDWRSQAKQWGVLNVFSVDNPCRGFLLES